MTLGAEMPIIKSVNYLKIAPDVLWRALLRSAVQPGEMRMADTPAEGEKGPPLCWLCAPRDGTAGKERSVGKRRGETGEMERKRIPMKKLFARVLAAAMLVSLFSVNALAADGYSAQTVTDYDGNSYSFSSAKVEKQDLTIDWVEGDTLEEKNATVITMEPGSTLQVSGKNILAWNRYMPSADTGNCSILYDGTVSEEEGNRSYTTDELFGYNDYWKAEVVMVSFVESFDSKTGGKNAYIVLGDEDVQPEPEPEQPQQVFSDVAPTDWYAGFVQTVYEKGLFAGTGDGTFAPNANMTYAEFFTVLSQFDEVLGVTPVEGGEWYDAYVQWAQPYLPQNMKFEPTAPITRQDMAALMGNFIDLYGAESDGFVNEGSAVYTDADDIAGYARDSVQLCYRLGIMSGGDDGSFAPQATATRAQVAVVMVQMARVMGK